jgi:hypothetical protein
MFGWIELLPKSDRVLTRVKSILPMMDDILRVSISRVSTDDMVTDEKLANLEFITLASRVEMLAVDMLAVDIWAVLMIAVLTLMLLNSPDLDSMVDALYMFCEYKIGVLIQSEAV